MEQQIPLLMRHGSAEAASISGFGTRGRALRWCDVARGGVDCRGVATATRHLAKQVVHVVPPPEAMRPALLVRRAERRRRPEGTAAAAGRATVAPLPPPPFLEMALQIAQVAGGTPHLRREPLAEPQQLTRPAEAREGVPLALHVHLAERAPCGVVAGVVRDNVDRAEEALDDREGKAARPRELPPVRLVFDQYLDHLASAEEGVRDDDPAPTRREARRVPRAGRPPQLRGDLLGAGRPAACVDGGPPGGGRGLEPRSQERPDLVRRRGDASGGEVHEGHLHTT